MEASEENEKLTEAFGHWVRGEFPEAKNIGDVVTALAARSEQVSRKDGASETGTQDTNAPDVPS